MGVLSALLILALLVVVHEAGHFFAAVSQGIRVTSFNVGFGPALLQKQRNGVLYALRLIPLGGFVAFPEDEPDNGIDPRDPDLLKNRPLSQRALVIAAGVIANVILAWVVLVGQGLVVGILWLQCHWRCAGHRRSARASRSTSGPGARRHPDQPQWPAPRWRQHAVQTLVDAVKAPPAKSCRWKSNARRTLSVPMIPADLGGSGRIGAQLQPAGVENFRRPANPLEVISHANHDFVAIWTRTIDGFVTLVTHFGETAGQVSGPVKIVEMGASLAKQGGSSLFLYTALISINLAVLNSLPLPMLDGGQFALLLLEGLRRKPLPEKFQMAFMQSGFVLLVGLSVVLIVKDTSQLAAVQQLLGR